MAEKKATKQIILDKALNLFAVNGYDGVTVEDIANAVGIKASSLYKHYKGKQDIFDSIFMEMAGRYNEMTKSLGIDGNIPEKDMQKYSDMHIDALVQTGTSLFLYFLHDEYALKFRRMLTIEQYRNPKAAKLYMEHFIDSPLLYQSELFKAFMKQNTMKKLNPKIAAMHFYAPIFLMLCLCDSSPDREPEALRFIEQHIMQYNKLYMIGETL